MPGTCARLFVMVFAGIVLGAFTEFEDGRFRIGMGDGGAQAARSAPEASPNPVPDDRPRRDDAAWTVTAAESGAAGRGALRTRLGSEEASTYAGREVSGLQRTLTASGWSPAPEADEGGLVLCGGLHDRFCRYRYVDGRGGGVTIVTDADGPMARIDAVLLNPTNLAALRN